MLMDPPSELAAAVITVGFHDLSRTLYFGGAFNLDAAETAPAPTGPACN
jgi:hypothetical protein